MITKDLLEQVQSQEHLLSFHHDLGNEDSVLRSKYLNKEDEGN